MKNITLKNRITALVLVLVMVLSMSVPSLAAENPVAGPKLVADDDSPTGYTGQFVYYAPDAQKVYFCGDLMLSNHADPTDTKVYTPFEYKPGLMRRGGSQFKQEMTPLGNGYWYYEVPLAAGANQYWFNVDNGTRMLPDPANHPQWSPGSNWNTKNAYNAIYVPYDPVKQNYEPMGARVVENPRTDGKTGTWSYVAIQVSGVTRYLGVYLPYGYDPDREEPYKTIYMQHGGGQDESDWMGIGSVQNIMDNLAAEGLTEPAVIVTPGSQYLGSAAQGYPNLFNIVIPFIEENYNVSKEVADRAFAGLSMGSMLAQGIINYDASTFGYFGPWSGGVSVRADAPNLEKTYIFFGSGLYEGGVDISRFESVDANVQATRVAGAHDFNTWCQLFTIFARDYLWKPEAFIIDKVEKLLDKYLAAGEIDNAGIYKSLMAQLKQEELTSFINHVEAQSGKHISSEAAAILIMNAERVTPSK